MFCVRIAVLCCVWLKGAIQAAWAWASAGAGPCSQQDGHTRMQRRLTFSGTRSVSGGWLCRSEAMGCGGGGGGGGGGGDVCAVCTVGKPSTDP